MARDRSSPGAAPESVISIIGPGMRVVGDCETEGTIRIEGLVEGTVRAGKAVVVGQAGVVTGDISTQDAVISGKIVGTLQVQSRLELQGTCRVEGEIHARRMQLEEGAVLNGAVHMGEQVGATLQESPRESGLRATPNAEVVEVEAAGVKTIAPRAG